MIFLTIPVGPSASKAEWLQCEHGAELVAEDPQSVGEIHAEGLRLICIAFGPSSRLVVAVETDWDLRRLNIMPRQFLRVLPETVDALRGSVGTSVLLMEPRRRRW